MRILVLGAGPVGRSVASELLREPEVTGVTLLDRDVDRLDEAWARLSDDRLRVETIDLAPPGAVRPFLESAAAVVAALPSRLLPTLADETLAARRGMVAFGRDAATNRELLGRDERFREAGVALLPAQGLAPGLASIVAGDLADRFDRCDSVRIRLGCLPARPTGALGYRGGAPLPSLVFECTADVEILRGGQRRTVPALSGFEPFELPPPFGAGEAALTAAGGGTFPATFEGKVGKFDFKAVRYPKHFEKMRVLVELGLLGSEPVELAGGLRLAPVEVTAALLETATRYPDLADLVVFRVVAQGEAGGQLRKILVDALDFGEPARGLTAALRMTAAPVAAIARRLGRGDFEGVGAFPPERSISWDDLRGDLEERGLAFTERESVVGTDEGWPGGRPI